MNISILTSEIAIVLLAVLIMLFDLVLPRQESRRSLGYLAAWGVFAIFVYTFTQYGMSATVYKGLFIVDNFAVFFKQIFLISTLLLLLFSFDYVQGLSRNQGEFYALMLFAVAGMMIMASANDLLTIFVGLELMTVIFYILVGFNFASVKSSEAGMKYLILGSASSAVLLYGMSWVYGATGSIALQQISMQVTEENPALLLGLGLMLAGIGFKLAIAPFHMWAPDIYEGAPTPITAMLAMGSKAAGFTVVAMRQTNIKRMIGYSSIAQAGYMLAGLLAADVAGVQGMLFYTMLYVFANVGAFAVIVAVGKHGGSDEIEDLSGLSQKSPFLALSMTVALLSMAGIPPMAGFVGKFYIFMAVIEQGYLWMAIIGFVMSMISVYYYLQVVKTMYMKEPKDEQPLVILVPIGLAASISILVTLFLGIYPAPLAKLAKAAAQTLW
ncbi:MAG: NAD(P)H-quinone oxidoreductase subunit 2 [Sporomusa sp.]|nr:NAD(P)H-quinone oxidoreductase subunit 2 [Sporomusa sp.]